MAQWTNEQLTAINAENASVIVSAAAGSGKTSVLVERLLRQLSDTVNKIPAETMIVVTFTRNAASEMKQRLSAVLSEQIEQYPQNIWLQRQQAMLPSAKISTIHSFCFSMIKENLKTLDISAGVRMADEKEEIIIVKKCIEELIEKEYKENPDKMDILYNWFCEKSDDELETKVIFPLYKFLMSIPFGEKWLERATQTDSREKLTENFTEIAVSKLKSILINAGQAYRSAKEADKTKVAEAIKAEYEQLEKAYEILGNENIMPAERLKVDDITFASRLNIKSAKDDEETALKSERIKDLRDSYKEDWSELFGEIQDIDLSRDERIYSEIMPIIRSLMAELTEMIWKVKVEKNIIGFGDAEQLAVRLLAELKDDGRIVKTPFAKELSEYYTTIMIDEFQDSNRNQELIFKMLSKDGDADIPGYNMFMVGDIKQSIYSFRRANPKIFIETMNISEPYPPKASHNSYVRLNRNFRSSDGVINFVNFVFSHIMSRETGDIEYNQQEMLVQGRSFPNIKESRNTEIMFMQEKDARIIAETINEMLKSGYPVTESDGTLRKCRPSDFCILMRRNSPMEVYSDELDKLKILSQKQEKAGYLKSREISLLLNLLRVVDNPLLDTALSAVMFSPMFAMTADEVAEIRLTDRTKNLYYALCKSACEEEYTKVTNSETGETEYIRQASPVAETTARKALEVYATISDLRMISATSTIEGLIRKIYASTDFLSVMQVYKDSEQKKANLRLLLEYVRSYEQNNNGGLSGFIRYIDRLVETNEDLDRASTVTVSEDCVSIRNIHQSKGLEYPFVFLADTTASFNNKDKNTCMQINEESGIGFKLLDKTLLTKFETMKYKEISELNSEIAVNEEMRLLYVAMTRAKEKLFITLDVSDDKVSRIKNIAECIRSESGITSQLAGNAKSLQDWIVMSLLIRKDAEKIWERFHIKPFPQDDGGFSVDYRIFEPQEQEETDTAEEQENIRKFYAEPDMDTVRELKRMFMTTYDTRLSELPAKLTVSEIAKGGKEEFVSALKRPKFISENQSMTGAERGTALHLFMQYADFENAETDSVSEAERLVSMGILTESQGKVINHKRLAVFFRSPLFSRIKKSSEILRERKFLVKISDLGMNDELTEKYKGTDGMVQGIVDLAFEENGSLVVVDYKTDYTESAEALAEEYSRQLEIYKYALEQTERKNVSHAIVYSFGLGQAIELKF